MYDYNKVIIMGSLKEDPQINSGLIQFVLHNNTGDKNNPATPIICHLKEDSKVGKWVKNGSRLIVEGRLDISNQGGQTFVRIYCYSINIVNFAPRAKQGNGNPQFEKNFDNMAQEMREKGVLTQDPPQPAPASFNSQPG